jgi:hypothetical protein
MAKIMRRDNELVGAHGLGQPRSEPPALSAIAMAATADSGGYAAIEGRQRSVEPTLASLLKIRVAVVPRDAARVALAR